MDPMNFLKQSTLIGVSLALAVGNYCVGVRDGTKQGIERSRQEIVDYYKEQSAYYQKLAQECYTGGGNYGGPCMFPDSNLAHEFNQRSYQYKSMANEIDYLKLP